MLTSGTGTKSTVPSPAIGYIPSPTVSQPHHRCCKDSCLGWCPPLLYFHFRGQLCGHTMGSCGPFSSDLPNHCNQGSSSTTACEPRTVCNLVTSVLPAAHFQTPDTVLLNWTLNIPIAISPLLCQRQLLTLALLRWQFQSPVGSRPGASEAEWDWITPVLTHSIHNWQVFHLLTYNLYMHL